MKKTHYIYLPVIAVLLGVVVSITFFSIRAADRAHFEIARLTADLNRVRADLDAMTRRYTEESAECSALSNYISNIPRKMDFAHPFGFSLRGVLDKDRILPSGIYIREGQYDDYEIADTVVDKDTMAFAKLSGSKIDEIESKDMPDAKAHLEKRLAEDLAAARYPFKVSTRVWDENGILNFEIIDTEMFEKMLKREMKSRDQSCEMMKAFRDK